MSTKKTSSISFRINDDFQKKMREEAEEKRISLNTLANQIFGDHVEFENYARKFGTIRMSSDTFRRILDGLDEKTIIDIGTRCGSEEAKEFILFKWKEISLDSVTDFIKIYFDHCGYGRCSLEKSESKIVFSVHHDLQNKGSQFLKYFMESLIRTTLDKDCKTTVTNDTVTISFQA